MIGGYLLATRHLVKVNRWIILGGFCVFGCNALFTVANKLTTAANAIVLQFTAPIFVLIFSKLFLKRKAGKLDVGTAAVVFGGIAFFFLDSLEMGGGLGNAIALASGICYAGVLMMNEMPDSDAISSVFWGDVLSAAVGLPFLIRETQFPSTAIISLLVLGVFQVGAAYICLCIGLKSTPSVTASLIAGIEPVLNPLLVAVFYGEEVGTMAILGALIVITAVISYNVVKARQDAIPTKIKIN